MNDINIGKLSKKSNRKLKKVTDLKTKELNENAMERKCKRIVSVICGNKSTSNIRSDQYLISHYINHP